MKNKAFWWAIRITAVLAVTVSIGALAQNPTDVHLSGLINDYSAIIQGSSLAANQLEEG